MKKLLLILIIYLSLFAEYEWSNPKTVSGIYWCSQSSITVDNNGVISALWCKKTDLGGNYYGSVYFTQSFNGGDTWTGETNITPGYDIDPLWEMRAVTDSNNNIHLIYAKRLAMDQLIYKKYNGTSWSDDHTINFSIATNMRYGIDNSDRLFASWTLSSTAFYMYCNTSNDSVSWSTPKKIHPDTNYRISDFTYNSNNDIHAIGTFGTELVYRPYYYFFDKNLDDWTAFEEISNYDEKTLGCAIILSQFDSLYANTAVGYSMIDNTDNKLKKYIDDSTWSNPTETGTTNNWWDRKMFIDKKTLFMFLKST